MNKPARVKTRVRHQSGDRRKRITSSGPCSGAMRRSPGRWGGMHRLAYADRRSCTTPACSTGARGEPPVLAQAERSALSAVPQGFSPCRAVGTLGEVPVGFVVWGARRGFQPRFVVSFRLSLPPWGGGCLVNRLAEKMLLVNCILTFLCFSI